VGRSEPEEKVNFQLSLHKVFLGCQRGKKLHHVAKWNGLGGKRKLDRLTNLLDLHRFPHCLNLHGWAVVSPFFDLSNQKKALVGSDSRH
jgi:hypothetical protein